MGRDARPSEIPASRFQRLGKNRETRLLLLLAPLLYALYALLVPPFQTFDENQHLYRAWQISSFSLIGERHGRQSGAVLPAGLAPATLQQIGSLVPQGHRLIIRRPAAEMFALNTPVGNDGPHIFFDFFGAVTYPPATYIPQVGAIWIGNALGLSVEWIVRLGRLINATVCIALIACAMRQLPFGRPIMLIVALLPPTASAAASFGQDALIIGASLLLTAIGLNVVATRRWSTGSIAIAGVSAMLTISKLVYLPLAGVAAFPKPPQTSWWRWLRVPVLIVAASAALLAAWMHVAASAAVSTTRSWMPSVAEQAAWILAHPLSYAALLGRTGLVWTATGWLKIYSFGDSTIPPIWSAAIFGTAALFLAMLNGDSKAAELTLRRRAWLMCLVMATSLLMATVFFLTGTPQGAVIVYGIQGRYFIPVLPILCMALMRPGDPGPPRTMVIALALTLAAHAATLGTMLAAFYSF